MSESTRRGMWPPRGGAALPIRHAVLVAILALVLGLAVTWAVQRALASSMQAEAQAHFDGAVRRLEYDVQRRIILPAHGLRGLAAAYQSVGELGPAQFREWVAARQLDAEFPGVRGFGLMRRVQRGELEAFVARMRAADPQFQVMTSGDASDLFVVTDIEPRAVNASAWGFDAGQERLRRAALERAVDTGGLALTDRIAVRQDELGRAGWLMVLPVYRRGTDPDSPERRRRLLVGLLYAPIVAAEVLADVRRSFEAQVDFRLYDGPVQDGQLLFDSTDGRAQGLSTGARGGWDQRNLRATRSFALGGQELTLDLASKPEFEAGASAGLPFKVAITGALLSVLLALSVWQLASGRRRAEATAQGMTGELSRVANELSANEAFLEQAQRIANVGGWQVDLETGSLRLSAQTLRLFDLPPDATRSIEEFIGFFVPASRELIERATQEAIRDGRPWDLELNLVSAKGASRWMRTVGQVDRQGDWSVRLIGTLQDISDRKQAEQALQASEQFMRVVTDNLPGRVVYWNRDQRCEFANRRSAEPFGRTQEQMIGCSLREVLGDERYQAYRPGIEAALRGESLTFEREERSAAGVSRTMLVHYIPNFREEAVHGYFVLELDVTELKEAREAARQASAAKGQFLANTSHELRTPMNAIIGMLALLHATQLSVRQADYVAKAEGAARSLLALLNDILDFSKIEAGKLVLDPRPFRLESLMRDLAVIMSSDLRSEEVEILFDLDPALPPVLVGDDMRLRQVLINLGGNAVKFTERGEVVVGVRLLERAGGHGRVEFSVSDTGIGIAPELRTRIFEEFTQAEASTVRRYAGTGLGLAISQRLVKLMGGTLEVAGETGRGSRFFFAIDLPLGRDEAAGETPGAAPLRALFVDDNAVAREMLQAQARGLGWEADTAGGAEQALAAVQASARPYGAIFIDWRMPQVDGLETAARMRGLPQVGQSALVIMVSAQALESFAALGDSARGSFDGYLVKPVTASMLRDAVREATGRAAPAGPARQGGRELDGLRILVVEDNVNNQQIARELLAWRGAAVDIAEDGRQGVERVVSAPDAYDLVLMDVQMPVMDGYEAARQLRRAGFAALPIVAMTANVMTGDREACLAAGMNDHVGKPFDLDELVATVRRHAVRKPAAGVAAPEPVAAAAPSAAVPDTQVDLAAAVRRMGGDIGFYRQLYPSVRSDADKMLARLEQLLASRQRDDAARLFHTIKGHAGTIGAPALARVAGEAERALRAPGPDPEADLRHLASTRRAYEAACVLLDDELSRLASA